MTEKKVLYVVASATLAATRIDVLVQQALDDGWDTWVFATPNSLNFLDSPRLEQLTGHPVRSQYRHYTEPKPSLPAEAAIVAGTSFNTINKWALGLADNQALSTLCELLGARIPIVLLPYLSQALAAHPAFEPSIATLRKAGVRVLLEPNIYQPHPPNGGTAILENYPWSAALQALPKSGR